MMCMYSSMWMHGHIYSWKLGPGLILLAEVCPWIQIKKLATRCFLLFLIPKFQNILYHLELAYQGGFMHWMGIISVPKFQLSMVACSLWSSLLLVVHGLCMTNSVLSTEETTLYRLLWRIDTTWNLLAVYLWCPNSQLGLPALITKIRQGWKHFPEWKTLAY